MEVTQEKVKKPSVKIELTAEEAEDYCRKLAKIAVINGTVYQLWLELDKLGYYHN